MTRRRVDIWLAEHEFRAVDEAAERVGVETGAVARLAVIRAFHGVCRDVSEGRVRLRRRSGADPVPSSAAPTVAAVEKEPSDNEKGVVSRSAKRAPVASQEAVRPAAPSRPSLDQWAMFERLRP